jgi:uncharacterized membrane protein YdjX (TVP38/TMEM64 family)
VVFVVLAGYIWSSSPATCEGHDGWQSQCNDIGNDQPACTQNPQCGWGADTPNRLWVAMMTSWLGGMLGALACWLIGRRVLAGALERMCWSRSKLLQEVQTLMGDPHAGWRWALLVRLPYMPFPQMCYALSGTKISLRDYVVTTAIGSVPGVVIYVLVGSSVGDFEDFLAGRGKTSTVVMVLQCVSHVASMPCPRN